MFKGFLCGLMVLMSTNTAVADETIFKINNSLAKFDLSEVSESYTLVFDQLIHDLKNGGISFTHAGTLVSTLHNGESHFTIKNVQIQIKKEVWEKYAQHAVLTEKKVFFKKALDSYGYYIFNNDERPTKYQIPQLTLRLDVLDKNGSILASKRLKSELPGYSDVTIEGFFEYLTKTPVTEHRDVQIGPYLNFMRNHQFQLSLEQIQKIDSLRFSVLNYK